MLERVLSYHALAQLVSHTPALLWRCTDHPAGNVCESLRVARWGEQLEPETVQKRREGPVRGNDRASAGRSFEHHLVERPAAARFVRADHDVRVAVHRGQLRARNRLEDLDPAAEDRTVSHAGIELATMHRLVARNRGTSNLKGRIRPAAQADLERVEQCVEALPPGRSPDGEEARCPGVWRASDRSKRLDVDRVADGTHLPRVEGEARAPD